MYRRREGRERKDERIEGVGMVGKECLKRAALKLKGISRRSITRTAEDELSSEKCNFGIAPACMPSSRSLFGSLDGAVLLLVSCMFL